MPLTDAQWAWIEPLLPDRAPKRGGRWPDHREVIDVIAFKFQTGTQWVHLPEKYGNWRGTYNRLRMWAIDGTWEQVFTALMAQADAGEDINGVVSVDSTIVRAHQHAAGAPQKVPLWIWSSRSRCGRLVEGAVSEHGEEDVDAASGECDEGGDVVFSLASFAVVVGA